MDEEDENEQEYDEQHGDEYGTRYGLGDDYRTAESAQASGGALLEGDEDVTQQ